MRPRGTAERLVSIPYREFALLRHRLRREYPSQGRFQSLTGNLPFCGELPCRLTFESVAVSIPYREFALLRRRAPCRHCGEPLPCFNPLQGICPSAAGVAVSDCHDAGFNPLQGICPSAATMAQSRDMLNDDVSIPYREFALLRPGCQRSLGLSLIVSIPYREFALLRRQIARQGLAYDSLFQSLTGNLPFCGACGPPSVRTV